MKEVEIIKQVRDGLFLKKKKIKLKVAESKDIPKNYKGYPYMEMKELMKEVK